MPQHSLGFLEARGLVALVQAVDAMLKAADITVVKYDRIGMAFLTATIMGDVGGVRAAIDAGLAAGRQVDEVRASVIANPSPELVDLLGLAESVE